MGPRTENFAFLGACSFIIDGDLQQKTHTSLFFDVLVKMEWSGVGWCKRNFVVLFLSTGMHCRCRSNVTLWYNGMVALRILHFSTSGRRNE